MPGRIIEKFELATNPTTKLWRTSRKPKEAKNVAKSCRGYFLLDVRMRLLAVSWFMRLAAGLCLQSPAGVRKEDSEWSGAHRRPYCRKRGRSVVIVLLLLLLALAVTAAEGSHDDHVKVPPPPGGSMIQQLTEHDLRSIHRYTVDTIEYLETEVGKQRERAKRLREEAKEIDKEADECQERLKVLRQTLQGCAKQDQPEEGESPGYTQDPDTTTQKLKLKFNGSLSTDTIYAKDSLLKYSDERKIKIELCRGDDIVTSGDFSSLAVEIVALEHSHTCKDDWSEEDFDRQIIRTVHGLVSVLDGETILELNGGMADLGKIQFKEGSQQQVGGKSVILAARVHRRSRNIIGTTRVEETFMDDYPFLVKAHRSKANEKFATPKLEDKVHGLEGIGNKYHNRLKQAGINTVQQFLMVFNEDPEKLRRQILLIKKVTNKSWKEMVEHAKKCDIGNDRRLKSCTLQCQKGEVTLFFNVVHGLVGTEFRNSFVVKDEFIEEQKVGVNYLLKQAYQKLNKIVKFDYIMRDNRPVKVDDVAWSRPVPISAAENLGSATGIDCADGAFPGTAGQSAPEPSRSDHRNGIASQGVGQNHTPEGEGNTTDDVAGAFSVNDVPMVEVFDETSDEKLYMLDLYRSGENRTPGGGVVSEEEEYNQLLAKDRDSGKSNSVVDGSSLAVSEQEEYNQLLAKVRDSGKSNSVVDASSGGNFDLSTDAIFGQDQGFLPRLFEDPLGQGTTFAALQQSQSSTVPGVHDDDTSSVAVNKSQQDYTVVNTQTIQDLRSMKQMPSLQVEDPSSQAATYAVTVEPSPGVAVEEYEQVGENLDTQAEKDLNTFWKDAGAELHTFW